jgi:probable rRNA maturation factor
LVRITRACERALARGTKSRKPLSLTILLEDDSALKALNRQFRGQNKATNVLAFASPLNAEGYLGDVAIAFGVAEREAKRDGKPFSDHAMHLAVHGVLHLLGYDHQTPREASRMERLEAKILGEFGLPDPYESLPNPA